MSWYLVAWEPEHEPQVIASGMNTRVAQVQCQVSYQAAPLRRYYLMTGRTDATAHMLATGGFRCLTHDDPELPALRAAVKRLQEQEASRS